MIAVENDAPCLRVPASPFADAGLDACPCPVGATVPADIQCPELPGAVRVTVHIAQHDALSVGIQPVAVNLQTIALKHCDGRAAIT